MLKEKTLTKILEKITGLEEKILLAEGEPIEKLQEARKKREEKREGKKKALPKPKLSLHEQDELFAEEGELSIDLYETEKNLVLKSAVAGIDPEELDLAVEKDLITIRGERKKEEEKEKIKNYFYEECFWGRFSRTVVLPCEIEPQKVQAYLKNGILTVILQKAKESKKTVVKIK